eukprot:746704-Hanusia_phi.AAC.5
MSTGPSGGASDCVVTVEQAHCSPAATWCESLASHKQLFRRWMRKLGCSCDCLIVCCNTTQLLLVFRHHSDVLGHGNMWMAKSLMRQSRKTEQTSDD